MAQGAKPGEGGQLPGSKVSPLIAELRFTKPGVTLISPPPHHDIYSIEDLAQLIFDLKQVNPHARVAVKLVSTAGVGTIAAGVAKCYADKIIISGADGGTGAAPIGSIRFAGNSWELGLIEAHNALKANHLRGQVTVETDGGLKTGLDVVKAAILGAEEYAFGTGALVLVGCIMLRVCHLNTCPVGIATQNPELRKKFKGKPEHVVNYMYFVAQELREIMAKLGFKSVNEMVGQVQKINASPAVDHYKAKGVDLSAILYQPKIDRNPILHNTDVQNHNLDKVLDLKIIDDAKASIKNKQPLELNYSIQNTNRSVGAITSNEISKLHGEEGLPEDTLTLNFKGSAGQSFGAFATKGLTMTVDGETNDYLGKGLSGAKIVVKKPKEADFKAEENIIVGNVCFYGAVKGEAYINGIAGERFCVRNSGITAVVEGIGDHGCEYMTGGKVVVLGKTGRNFAAGMSGGIAYVYDPSHQFRNELCNLEMVELVHLETKDQHELKDLVKKHTKYTESALGQQILKDWEVNKMDFIKVYPTDYRLALERIEQEEKTKQKLTA